jgi:alanine-synthesizing transaminase
MFSSRLPAALDANLLAQTVARFRDNGTPVIDLTETNPTRAGVPYPTSILSSLNDASALTYEPSALGLLPAREAVSREYARQGAGVPPDRIVLTASTSEAYSLLFKLLCNAEDEVLIPQPSYPLFELLSRLDLVRAVPYSLAFHGRWSLDRESIERALSPRTRAILIVSPNNPTGSILRHDDVEWLAALCAARGMAIIADEVFADYRFTQSIHGFTDSQIHRLESCLCFRLGGLSKSAGLPQMKLGWIAVNGPDDLVAGALSRLEWICDTYLSVATPVQVAAAALIKEGAVIRAAIQQRLAENLQTAKLLAAEHPHVTLFEPEAGWSAVLQVPATATEEEIVLRLLDEHHVLVHPGYFFDFPSSAFLVISLLPRPEEFAKGLRAVMST